MRLPSWWWWEIQWSLAFLWTPLTLQTTQWLLCRASPKGGTLTLMTRSSLSIGCRALWVEVFNWIRVFKYILGLRTDFSNEWWTRSLIYIYIYKNQVSLYASKTVSVFFYCLDILFSSHNMECYYWLHISFCVLCHMTWYLHFLAGLFWSMLSDFALITGFYMASENQWNQ